MNKEDKILVIVPCYNEEQNLRKVISELRDVEKKISNLVFFFINDSSLDNTEGILREEGMDYINHPVNLGYNYAIQTGLKYGLKYRFKYFILMDGDGQHPPSEIEKLIGNYKEEVDLLIGSRFKDGFMSTYEIPIIRKLGMMFFSFFTSFLIGSKIRDTTSGFQMFNDNVARAMYYIYEAKYPDAEAILLLRLFNFKIKEIPVVMRKRLSGKSMISSFSSFYYPIRVLFGLFLSIGRYFVIRGKIDNA